MEEISNIDVRIQEIARELRTITISKHEYSISDKKLTIFVCFGFLISVTVDQSFMGEASCMMDLYKVCEVTTFDSFKTAMLLGINTFLIQIGVVGFLMLLQYMMLEMIGRVEKIQICLLALEINEKRVSKCRREHFAVR